MAVDLGGVTRIAKVAHRNRPMVACGKRELALPPNPTGRTRAPGPPQAPSANGGGEWRPARDPEELHGRARPSSANRPVCPPTSGISSPVDFAARNSGE